MVSSHRPTAGRSVAVVLVACVCTAWSIPTLAITPGAIEIGGFTGYALLRADSELGNAADPGLVPDSAPLLGLRATYHLAAWVGAEAEARRAFSSFRSGGGDAPVLGWRVQAIATLPLRSAVVPFATFGFGGETLLAGSGADIDRQDTDSATLWGVGARWQVTERWGLRLDGRLLHMRARDGGLTWNGEAQLGAYLLLPERRPPPATSDHDGPPDSRHKCRTVAGKGPDGCAPDGDGDGVADDDDKCPNVAGNGPDGCARDTDGDGVADEKDKCPRVAAKGPDGCAPDGDGDGVPDGQDKCPNVAGKGTDGCPPDRDGDGVPDDIDKSPDEPETVNGYQDDDGAPDVVPSALRRFTGTIAGIRFDTDTARIRPRSRRLLDKAVKVLQEFESLHIEIAGFTDNVGAEAHNRDLSLRRARAVRDYFVAKGVAASRITTVGHGSERPVASNETAAGRARNRRIEFSLN